MINFSLPLSLNKIAPVSFLGVQKPRLDVPKTEDVFERKEPIPEEDLENCKKQLKELQEQLEKQTNDILPLLEKKRGIDKDNRFEIYARYLKNPDSEELQKIYNRATSTARKSLNEYRKALSVENYLKKQINLTQKKIEKLELFIEMHAENPRVSYLYSPYLIYEQKVNRASHDSNLTLLNSLHSSNIAVTMAQQSGIPVHTISRGKAEKSYVDINDKASFEFVEDFKEKSKNILTVSEFITRYNVPGAARAKYTVTNGCIDLNIPQNKALLKRHLKLFPQPSKLYSKQGFDGKTSFVPIPYLVKLGYGSEESLLNLIKSKQIQGVIKEDATEKSGYKAWVNIANSDTEFILQVERRDNPNCISPKSLAQRLKITKSEVDSAIVSGSLEIIPKYIFTSDFNTPLIDLTVDKNAQFVEAISLRKQAEKEALYQERLAQKAQKEEYKKANGSILDLKNYLRMKLVWHLCPHTRTMQGKTLVYEKPWVMSIINKINCEGYSALSTDEKKQYLAYCKASWLNSGTDEFKDAHKLAKHYTDLYFEKGIDAIKDENIKIFILETMN